MRRRAWIALAALLPIGCIGTRAASRHFVFRGAGTPEKPLDADVTPFTATAADGAVVHAAELAGADGAPVVVHFHDNRQTIADAVPFARALRSRGLDVVLVEYRGYGASIDEAPSEQGAYLDAEAIVDALGARGVGRDRIVLSGRSLGTGIAAELARRHRGAALVLFAPYTSIPDLVAPIAPARWLVADVFDTASKTAEIQVPTLIVHGEDDEIVPFRMGVTLARSIDGARLLPIPHARHDDVFDRDRPRVLQALDALVVAARI